MKQPFESQPPEITNKLPVTVAEVMTKDVVTINPRQSLVDAISLIAVHHFHHLLVTDIAGKPVGIVSGRDILRAVARTPDWHAYEIRHVMTVNPVTVAIDSSLALAVSQMLSKRFNSLPVVGQDGVVVGILTSTDVLWSYQKMAESMQIGFDKCQIYLLSDCSKQSYTLRD